MLEPSQRIWKSNSFTIRWYCIGQRIWKKKLIVLNLRNKISAVTEAYTKQTVTL